MIKPGQFVDELTSLGTVLEALQPLDAEKRKFVISTAVQRLGIRVEGFGAVPTAGAAPLGADTTASAASAETPKAFVKRKHPTTDVQRIACLAYYLTHVRKISAFKTRALTQLNTEAAGDPFANATVTVKNATKQNHFLSPAGQGRKQITGLGEDIVDALPDQEKVKGAIATGTAGRRKRRAHTVKKKKS